MKISVLTDKLVLEDLTMEEQLILSTAISCNRCMVNKGLESAFYCYLWERKVELDNVSCVSLLTGLDNLTCDCHAIWDILDGEYEYNDGEDRSMFYDDERLKMINETAHRVYDEIETAFKKLA